MFKNIITTVAIFTGSTIGAFSEVIDYMEHSMYGEVVLFAGKIEEGSSDRLEVFLTTHPTAKSIILVSPGGSSEEGYKIAEVLSDHSMTAIVPDGYTCLSACAVGFIGANNHVVDGILGFHNAFLSDSGLFLADLHEALGGSSKTALILFGQYLGAKSTVFFIKSGFELELPIIIAGFTNPSTFLVFTSTEELYQFKAATSNIGSYTVSNDFIDFIWIQDHLWGSEKLSEYEKD